MALARGFAVASNALDATGNDCNLVTQAESEMMTKERVIDEYGLVRYTMGIGGSGESVVQQAVANLLDNAIKFSPPGGEVRLTAEKIDGQVRLSVADQGPGIPETERARATERFFRGEKARNTPGSGLGLALVQAVATLHEGALLLEDAHPGLRVVMMLRAEPPRMNTASSTPHDDAIAQVAEHAAS